MSSGSYQVPATAAPVTRDAFAANANDNPTITYMCGDCNAKVPLKRSDPIRCRDCGHRVLYKERTKRMVQFEAR